MARNDTRSNILKAASRLFYFNGVNATGINEILKKSGASRGSFYHYFPEGKEQMAYETVQITCENQLTKTREQLFSKTDPVEAFQYRMQALIEEFSVHRGQDELSIGLVALESWHNSPKLCKLCDDTLDKMIAMYAEKLVSCGFPEDVARRIGMIFQIMVDGSLVLSVSHKDVSAFKEVQEQIKVIIENARSALPI